MWPLDSKVNAYNTPIHPTHVGYIISTFFMAPRFGHVTTTAEMAVLCTIFTPRTLLFFFLLLSFATNYGVIQHPWPRPFPAWHLTGTCSIHRYVYSVQCCTHNRPLQRLFCTSETGVVPGGRPHRYSAYDDIVGGPPGSLLLFLSAAAAAAAAITAVYL